LLVGATPQNKAGLSRQAKAGAPRSESPRTSTSSARRCRPSTPCAITGWRSSRRSGQAL